MGLSTQQGAARHGGLRAPLTRFPPSRLVLFFHCYPPPPHPCPPISTEASLIRPVINLPPRPCSHRAVTAPHAHWVAASQWGHFGSAGGGEVSDLVFTIQALFLRGPVTETSHPGQARQPVLQLTHNRSPDGGMWRCPEDLTRSRREETANLPGPSALGSILAEGCGGHQEGP